MFNKRSIETLKMTINNLEDDLQSEKAKVIERDKLIKDYQEEHEILLKNEVDLKLKIVDLKNNIEFLYNNLTPKKKEKNKKID